MGVRDTAFSPKWRRRIIRAQKLEVERSKFRKRMPCVKDLVPRHCPAQLLGKGRAAQRLCGGIQAPRRWRVDDKVGVGLGKKQRWGLGSCEKL